MDVWTFISSLVGHLAWPMTILLIFLVAFFKSDKISKIVESVRYGDVEVVLRDKFSEAQKSAEVIRPQLDRPQVDRDDRFAQLANIEPAAAVIHVWGLVESEIARSQEETRSLKFLQSRDYVRMLKGPGKLTEADVDLFESLRIIRNSAVHARGNQTVTRAEAMEFRDLAELFLRRLRQVTRSTANA